MTLTLYYIISAIFDLAMGGILVFAAIDDVKTRIVKPWIQYTILGISVSHFLFVLFADLFSGIAEITWWDWAELLFAGALMFTIYIALVLIFKKGIGGADTKVSSMMAFYLGVWPSVIMVVGHFLSAIIYVVYEKLKNHKHIASVPLMVFIGIGYLVTLIVKWLTIII